MQNTIVRANPGMSRALLLRFAANEDRPIGCTVVSQNAQSAHPRHWLEALDSQCHYKTVQSGKKGSCCVYWVCMLVYIGQAEPAFGDHHCVVQVALFQYPLRPPWRPYEMPDSTKVKLIEASAKAFTWFNGREASIIPAQNTAMNSCVGHHFFFISF